MPDTRNESVVLNYAAWRPIYKTEAPYQILSEFHGDYPKTNLQFGPAPVSETVHDMRGNESEFKIDLHGFQIARHETSIADWSCKETIEGQYFSEMEALLKATLDDVHEVFFYDWRSRKNEPFKMAGIDKVDLDDLSQYLLPVGNAHVDLSPLGVIKRVQYHLGDRAETLLKGRVRAVNVWRPTSSYPVQDRPLAVCDGATVRDSDLLATDHVKKGYVGQTSNLMYRPGYRWYYLNHQVKEECFVFKMYDSLAGVAKHCPHVAFRHNEVGPDAPPRQSFEIRALVFTHPPGYSRLEN